MARSGEKSTERGAIAQSVLWLLRVIVRAYQYFLSPLLGPRCRYLPSCSSYALEALDVHGPWRGSWYALRRIARCHPWGGTGYDPVPAAKDVIR
jgi:putative membrane protein insertion efficiency factor